MKSGATCTTNPSRLTLPILKSFHQPDTIAKSTTHDKDMHNLMTRPENIEPLRIPALRNPDSIDGCSSEVKDSKSDEVAIGLSLILHLPAIFIHTVRDGYERRCTKQ